MKNKMKMLGAFLALGAVVVNLAFPSSVLAGQATKPREAGGNQSAFDNPSMIGCKPARADFSTAAQLIVSGSGFLYWLTASGTLAAAGAVSQAFDTSSAATITAFNQTARAISPVVYATGAAASALAGNIGKWDSGSAPVRFENGLVLMNSANTHNALACYRLDSGVNP